MRRHNRMQLIVHQAKDWQNQVRHCRTVSSAESLPAWSTNSWEHQERLNTLLGWFVDTGYPVTQADNLSFRRLMMSMDTKFKMPASATINNLLKDRMEYCVVKLKDLLASSRRVTICLDGWTKKGLSASFLGISACFFNPRT